MSSIITYEQAKMHLRITSDAEQSEIEIAMAAAQSHMLQYMGLDVMPGQDESPEDVPSELVMVALMFTAGFYECRTSHTTNAILENPFVLALMNPYRENMGV